MSDDSYNKNIKGTDPEIILEKLSGLVENGWDIMAIHIEKEDGFNVYRVNLKRLEIDIEV